VREKESERERVREGEGGREKLHRNIIHLIKRSNYDTLKRCSSEVSRKKVERLFSKITRPSNNRKAISQGPAAASF
jgi:hypothetical protein